MALRYRPYYPKRYGYGQTGGTDDNAVARGMKIGQELGAQGEALVKAIQARKQDEVANQLSAQSGLFTPRAKWVGGNAPAAGVDTKGTSLWDAGGVAGLKMRLEMQQRQNEIASAQAKADLSRAVARSKMAGSGNTSRWAQGNSSNAVNRPSGSGTGKTAKYVPGSYDYENGTLNNVKTPDSLSMIREDLDAATTKGTSDKLMNALPALSVQNGKLVVDPKYKNFYQVESDGSLSFLDQKSGGRAGYIPANVLQTVIPRYNSLQVRSGGNPIGNPFLQSQNPNTNFAPGSDKNPYLLDKKNPSLTLRSLPIDSYFVDPNGQTQQKRLPQSAQLQQQTQAAPQPKASDFPIPSEGGTSTNLLRNPSVKPTASTDSGGDVQQVSVPYRPDTEISRGTGLGGTVWDPLTNNYGSLDSSDSNQSDVVLNPPNVDTSKIPNAVIPRQKQLWNQGTEGDRIIMPQNDARPIQNVPAERNPLLQASDDSVLPNKDQVPNADQTLLADYISRMRAQEALANA